MVYLYDAALYLAQALCVYGFLSSLPRRALPTVVRALAIVAFAALLALRGGTDGLGANPYSPARLLVLLLLVFAFCLALFDVGPRAALYFGVVVFLVEVAVERIAAALALANFPARDDRSFVLGDPAAAVFFLVVMVGGFVALLMLLKRRFLKVTRADVGATEIAVMLVSILPVIFIDNVDRWATDDAFGADFILVAHTLCSVVSLTTIVVVAHIVELEAEKSEKRVLEALLAASSAQYERRLAERERIDRAFHDVKHHVRYMANLDDRAERQRYAAEVVEGALVASDVLMCTGNEPMDVVLSDFSQRCRDQGVRLVLFVEARPLGFMRPSDIVTVAGNLLENALEACRGQGDAQIVVRIHGEGGWLVMHFENTAPASPEWDGDLPRSTKSAGVPGTHGLGLKSVAHVVESYGGTLRASHDGGRFVVNALIPIPPAAE